LVGEGSPLGQTYEKMARLGNMSGVVTDDQRANKELKTLLEDAANNLTATPQRRMSILADNPMVGVNGESVNTKLVPFNEYAQLTDAEKKEMQTYVYTDENGVEQKGTKRKYVELVVKNGNMVPEEDMNDRLAADRSAKSSLYAALKRDITGGGSRDSQFDPNSASSRGNKKQKADDIGRVTLANRIAVGGEDGVQALKEMKTSGIYTIANGFNEVIDVKGEQEIDGRRAMVYEVKTDASGNTEPRYVYITNKDGSFLTQSERVEQSLALIGTNPTQTQDLLDTYSKSGKKLTIVDEDALFSTSKITGGSRVKYIVDEQNDQAIGDIYSKSTSYNVTSGSAMAKDVKSYIANSFKDKGLAVPNGLKVTNKSDTTTISAGGITVSSGNESKKGLVALYNDFILTYNNRDTDESGELDD